MAVTTVDNWEYAQWVYIIGRSMRFNPPTGAEATAAQTFVTNVLTQRTWLVQDQQKKQAAAGQQNNNEYLGEMIALIGQDMKSKIQLLNGCEKGYCDTLFAATGNRRYGDKGNIGGSDVDHSGGY